MIKSSNSNNMHALFHNYNKNTISTITLTIEEKQNKIKLTIYD